MTSRNVSSLPPKILFDIWVVESLGKLFREVGIGFDKWENDEGHGGQTIVAMTASLTCSHQPTQTSCVAMRTLRQSSPSDVTSHRHFQPRSDRGRIDSSETDELDVTSDKPSDGCHPKSDREELQATVPNRIVRVMSPSSLMITRILIKQWGKEQGQKWGQKDKIR